MESILWTSLVSVRTKPASVVEANNITRIAEIFGRCMADNVFTASDKLADNYITFVRFA